MANDDARLEIQAQHAYETYWNKIDMGGTHWWQLNESHRERWRNVVRAIKKLRKRGTLNHV